MRALISLLAISLLFPVAIEANKLVDVQYVKDIKKTRIRGSGNLDDILRLYNAGATPEYVRNMMSMKMRNFDIEDATKLARAKITPAYVREAKAIPMGHYFDASDVLKMHSKNVPIEYLKELKSAHASRLRHFDENDVIKLHETGVSPKYVHDISNLGLRNFDANDVVKLFNADVSPKYAHDMKKVKLRNFDEGDLIKLSHANITPKFAREAKSIGMYDADAVIKLAQKFDGKIVEIAKVKPKPSRKTSHLSSITDQAALVGLIMLICYVAHRLYKRRTAFATPRSNDLDHRITHFEKRVGDLQDILISIDDRLNRQLKRT